MLTGRVINDTSEVRYEEIISAKGLDKFSKKLDGVYLQDKDSQMFKLTECGIELPDAILICQLLRSCSLSGSLSTDSVYLLQTNILKYVRHSSALIDGLPSVMGYPQ